MKIKLCGNCKYHHTFGGEPGGYNGCSHINLRKYGHIGWQPHDFSNNKNNTCQYYKKAYGDIIFLSVFVLVILGVISLIITKWQQVSKNNKASEEYIDEKS